MLILGTDTSNCCSKTGGVGMCVYAKNAKQIKFFEDDSNDVVMTMAMMIIVIMTINFSLLGH